MRYTNEPPVDEKKTLEPNVHVVGEKLVKEPSEVTGKETDTGPQAEERFPETDTWKGKPVDANYQTVPEDKEAISENLRRAGEDIQKRFGLDTRGMEVTQAEKDQTIDKDTK